MGINGAVERHLLKLIIKGGVISVTERVRAPLEVFSSHGSHRYRTSEDEVNRNIEGKDIWSLLSQQQWSKQVWQETFPEV